MSEREKDIYDLIDFAGSIHEQIIELYKVSVTLHNYCQRLLLKEKTGVELKDF